MTFAEEAGAFLRDHPDTRTVEVLFTDINGILRGKQYPVSVLDDLDTRGVNIPASTLLLDAQGAVVPSRLGSGFHGDPDAVFVPVEGTVAPVPWAAVPSLQILSTARDGDGAPHCADPRNILARTLEPFVARGLRPVVALESEFYLLDPEAMPPIAAAPPGTMPKLTGPQCLSMEAIYDFEPFIRDIEALCEDQSVGLTSILSEYGDGQFEANLRHVDDALAACDQLVMLKRISKAAARRLDLVASFMAKPITGSTGSGLHVHVSLIDGDGRNVFSGEDGEAMFRHAVGGVLATLPETIALICPNANSYRRFQPESFVPQVASWGPNHRSVAVRVPLAEDQDIRIEHRVAGADACPYLVVAAILAGIHHGIANEIEPGPMTHEGEPLTPSPPFPTRWPTALEAFSAAKVLPALIGEDFHTLYLTAKRIEEARYNAEVSERDHAWYFRIV